ncbi:MAG: integrase core domain-containing protein [bacterium]|nr:integrase core domain-containing protein [bacterium]
MQQIYLRPANIIQPTFVINQFKRKPIELLSKPIRWRKQADLIGLSPPARLRLEWMIFYETVGRENAYDTANHFGIAPKTFYKWRKRFAGGLVKELEDESTRPDHLRQWEVTFEEECRIKKLREKHLHYGKKKIKKLYFNKYGKQISTWKIERVITKHDLYPDPIQQEKNKKKLKNQTKKNRIQNLVIEEKIFFLFHLDTIVIHWNNIKRYILTACDHHGKIAYARMYTTKSSRSAKDFLYRLHYLIDAPLANVQTDNGTEFYAEFEEAITALEATHWFSRNRTPEDNAIVERFNQTLQDEWLNDGHFTPDVNAFNRVLTDWLEEYNFARPHQTLDYETPMSYYLNTLNFSPDLLPMWSARTSGGQFCLSLLY